MTDQNGSPPSGGRFLGFRFLLRPAAIAVALALAVAVVLAGTIAARAKRSGLVVAMQPVAASSVTRSPHRIRLLVIGGSIAVGYFATTAARSYPQVLARQLRTKSQSVSVVLRAASGATVADALRWQVAVSSDLVTVQIATNDFGRSVPLNRFSSDYHALLVKIRHAAPRARLACTGVWFDPAARNSAGIAAGTYNAAVRRQCLQAHGRYVNLAPIYLDPANRGPAGRHAYLGPADDFHPNDRGHQLIATAMLTALRG